jgi:RNA polymerase sigma-70 factor, ECF subfamily
MNTPTELDLLKGAKELNSNALAAIFDLYAGGLYRYAMRLLGDDQQARDCVSETFSRFLKGIKDGNGPQTYLKAYLYRMAHNLITDIYRRSPALALELTENISSDEKELPEKQIESRVETLRMRAVLRRLPPEQRQVVVLRFFEEWEYEQIAEALGKSPGNVRVLQHRALGALRQLLSGNGKDDAYGY